MGSLISQLKYLIFFAVFAVGIPAGYLAAKSSRLVEKAVFFLMIFFTCRMVDINFVSREWYRGTSRGFEIGLVDLTTIIILLLVIDRGKRFKLKNSLPPGSYLYLAYFVFSLLSLVNSALIVNSLFELWKMVRMFLYFWVIYNYIRDKNQLDYFMKVVSVIILYIFIIVLKQKYLEGIFQAKGPFPHQNSLVMYMNILNSLVYAYLLNKKRSNPLYWLFVFGAGSFIIVSTLSRGGIVCFALSAALISFLSLASGLTMKKFLIYLLLCLGGVAFLVKAADSIVERFTTAPEESANVRVELAEAAVNMANDRLFGIGLNNFGHKINPPYPYGAHIARRDEDELGGLVETVYLMIAAETGWHNLIVYLLFLFLYLFKAFRLYFKLRKSPYSYLAIGISGGLAAIYFESTLEWVLKQTNNFYQLMLIFALTAALERMVKKARFSRASRD